jgi:uncharacterized membrane protein YccC
MSELTEAIRRHGEAAKGTDLGGVLQWAALHIEAQDEALAELREEHAIEEAERLRLEAALHEAGQALEAALAAVRKPLCPPIELGRDYVAHINIMGAHGDPDYRMPNGMSVQHVDLRQSKRRLLRKQDA